MAAITPKINRWWVYQRERYPLFAHGPLIAAFSFSAVSFSSLLRGSGRLPSPGALFVAFITSLVFFLQLRIADEFKDFEDDARYRPYRPVPRGLVSLRELGVVGIAGALVQAGLAVLLHPPLLLPLVLAWLYMGLMTKEFFVRAWLKAHAFTYMWTHMLIMPLIDLYATACDWLVAGAAPPRGLLWFLVASFLNGMVVEIGRKIRAPDDEEHGVDTYTALWGRRTAVFAWLAAMLATGASAWMASQRIGAATLVAVLLCALLGIASVIGWSFLHWPGTRQARRFEPMSGAWTVLLYLSLGALPRLVHS